MYKCIDVMDAASTHLNPPKDWISLLKVSRITRKYRYPEFMDQGRPIYLQYVEG